MLGHNKSVGTINFSPVKGNYLASGSADLSLKLWDLRDIKTPQDEVIEVFSAHNTLIAHQKDINAVRFSPNEKLIASASQDKSINVSS